MSRFNPEILREYDIRGIYGETLHDADAHLLGQILAQEIRAATPQKASLSVAIGWDGRVSSPALKQALSEGFRASGVDVMLIGQCSSPMLYYTVFEKGVDGGVMITGSHNPPEYNGFKMMVGRDTLFGDRIKNFAAASAADLPLASRPGNIMTLAVQDDYIDRLLKDLEPAAHLNVAWDTANGVMGPVVEDFISRLKGRHTVLYGDVDGRFPNHHPDTTDERNLDALKRTVIEGGYDLGIGFDGDGDRIGVVDDTGTFVSGDRLMAILGEDVLATHAGAPIIIDIKASQAFFDYIVACGGTPVMARTGHSLIKKALKDHKAPLAGELSGHIFFADTFYGFDDALYAAVRLMNVIHRRGQKLSHLLRRVPDMLSTPEVRFECDDAQKFKVVEEIRHRLKQQNAHFLDIDGVRVIHDHGWWLLRASNTQNALSVRIEGRDKVALGMLIGECRAQLKKSFVDLPSRIEDVLRDGLKNVSSG